MIFIVRILRIVLIGIVIFFLYRLLFKGNLFGFLRRSKKSTSSKPLEEMKKDPICGTFIPQSQALEYKSEDQIHYFCSEECRNKYQKIEKYKNSK